MLCSFSLKYVANLKKNYFFSLFLKEKTHNFKMLLFSQAMIFLCTLFLMGKTNLYKPIYLIN